MKTEQGTAHSRTPHGTARGALPRFAALALSLVLVLSGLVACAPSGNNGSDTGSGQAAEQSYTPGTYTGTGTGNGGDITVEVTFSENAITDIKVVSQSETETVAAGALETIPAAVIEYQSLGVDTMSGATVSSLGLMAAITDCVEQAGGNASKLQKVPAQEKSTETVEKQADAIVIGGGGAGMAATIRLQELGKSVILVEKTYRLGGSISVSGGNQVVTGSKLQAEAGVTDDSAESMVEDFQKNGEDICVPELIELYANNVGETTDWIHEYAGVEYNMEGGLHDLAEYSHNRELAYAGGGAGATESLRAAVSASGADVLLDTTAESLIEENGAVVGVNAVGKDGTTYVLEADSVVLATGGYGNSDEYLTEELQNSLYYGLMGSTGDGLTMATAAGIDADTRLMEYAKLYPNGAEVSPGRAKSTIDGNLLVWPMSTILVNAEGERVVNEKASNHEILEVELEQTDSMLYLLMDQENFDVWSTKLKDTGFNTQAVESYLEANGSTTPIFAHGETIEELAGVLGMDPATLQATVDAYNAGVDAGTDEFGRTGEYLQMKIGEGPYYLVEQKPRYATTMGGLVVNDSLQVMNKSGEPIGGLYASGEVVGGVMGSNSPSGANNGWALTSGKLAAEAIAEQ
ncbi:FAD-dependent oxidoreductase [Raoultibacter phocaeensis]|uniref:FAD-dependent oxidoreductase n=1 Tax=Raoultibacter phocaeensis TaxID=2479841 RepID=UPI00111A6F08|nr:FAD-dependent oxidoreductase [Raoultibacter phocaeensis]